MMKCIFVGIVLISLLNCTENKKADTREFSESELAVYREQGLETALALKSALGSVLIPTVTQQGTVAALEFCNIEAIPLTDSVAQAVQLHSYRVSDQPRNPNNRANEQELRYIREAQSTLDLGEEIRPKIIPLSDKVVGYYPVMTTAFCLQCHGTQGTHISEETMEAIQKLYPEDEAIGYEENELRGIVVVEMPIKEANSER